MLERVLATLIVAPFLMGAAAADKPGGADVLLSLDDQRIDESSGLVVAGDLIVTVNDSGDRGRVFTLDRTGRTVGVTSWEDAATGGGPVDVEALAPAGDGRVWVGDTGDNGSSRKDIEVFRVPVGAGEQEADPEVHDLVYPDGAHDAESLFAGPDGRLYVVTKAWAGGTVYAAPARLDPERDNVLEQVGPAGGMLAMATDAAMLDAGHLIVRGYLSAALYEWPSLQRLALAPLPAQKQGEGLAVGPAGDLYLSSEGVHADVLRMPLPADFTAAIEPSASPAPAPTEAGEGAGAPEGESEESSEDRPVWPWALGGVVGVVMIGVLIRSLRPR